MNAAIQLKVIEVRDRELDRTILRTARAAGKTVKDQTRTVFKGMIRDALRINPPASAEASGKDAQRQGQAAISRDLGQMGFAPKDLKGFRTITKAFGRPISPVRVATRENPQFADPDAFHLARLASKHGGRVTRGGKQAFYVSRQKFIAMRNRLFAEIGLLASGWVPAADQLGVPVPAWIRRHAGSGRGSQLQVEETDSRLSMRVVNQFPDQAPAEEMIRRIGILKQYAINAMKRQLPYLLRAAVRK